MHVGGTFTNAGGYVDADYITRWGAKNNITYIPLAIKP